MFQKFENKWYFLLKRKKKREENNILIKAASEQPVNIKYSGSCTAIRLNEELAKQRAFPKLVIVSSYN